MPTEQESLDFALALRNHAYGLQQLAAGCPSCKGRGCCAWCANLDDVVFTLRLRAQRIAPEFATVRAATGAQPDCG